LNTSYLVDNNVFVDVYNENGVMKTTRNETYAIGAQSTSRKGQTVCATGGRHLDRRGYSFTTCGRVMGTGKSIGLERGETATNMCGVVQGDSGGPVYKNHRAYGLIASTVLGRCLAVYQDIGPALSAMKMRLGVAG